MKGATEYARLFETGQYGKFYLTSGKHARGTTFHIQILPESEKAKPNGEANLCTNENAVEVYGITGGNPGWTETYGWLYEGNWKEDFQKLVKERKAEIATEERGQVGKKAKEESIEKIKIRRLLADY